LWRSKWVFFCLPKFLVFIGSLVGIPSYPTEISLMEIAVGYLEIPHCNFPHGNCSGISRDTPLQYPSWKMQWGISRYSGVSRDTPLQFPSWKLQWDISRYPTAISLMENAVGYLEIQWGISRYPTAISLMEIAVGYLKIPHCNFCHGNCSRVSQET